MRRTIASENQQFAYAKTEAQTSYEVTAKLISAFVFATQTVQSLFLLNPKFQASSLLLLLYRPVCVRPGLKTQIVGFLMQRLIYLYFSVKLFSLSFKTIINSYKIIKASLVSLKMFTVFKFSRFK